MGKEDEYSTRILNGLSINEDMSLLDERLFQSLIIEKLTDVKDVIILGSSRSKQITLPLKRCSFFNHSISSAVLDDFIVLYKKYIDKFAQHPQVIIIECSPWWLNTNYDQSYASWEKDKIFRKPLNAFHRLCDLLSPTILQTLLDKKFKAFLYGDKPKIFESYLPDGHVKHNKLNKDIILQEVQKLSRFYNIENFTKIDAQTKLKFESFIKQLLSENIRLILFLPPYHPISYDKLIKNSSYQQIFEAQKFFISCAKSNNIEIVGSYNPKECNCNESDFFDWHHTYETSTPKIFGRILNSF